MYAYPASCCREPVHSMLPRSCSMNGTLPFMYTSAHCVSQHMLLESLEGPQHGSIGVGSYSHANFIQLTSKGCVKR